MTDGLLENIIQLEKRIQAEVAAERARAETWQARELSAQDEELAAARAGEERRGRERLAAEEAALLSEAAALEAAAAAWCRRLEALGDADLRSILGRHLEAVLPGGDHDHPHGQG